MNTNLEVINLTRRGIKLNFTALIASRVKAVKLSLITSRVKAMNLIPSRVKAVKLSLISSWEHAPAPPASFLLFKLLKIISAGKKLRLKK